MEELIQRLQDHEERSQKRYETLYNELHTLKGNGMDSGVNDKVDVHNIFKGMGGHDGFGMGGGLGAGLVGGVLGGLLFNRRGLGGDDGGGGSETRVQDTVFNTAVLSKLGSIEASVPLSALQTQNAIGGAVSQLALGTQQGMGNVKDAVQSLSLFLSNQLNTINQNVSEQGCQTRAAVQTSTATILDKINANTIAELQAELAESRSNGRSREVEVNVSQNVNQQQAQAQTQAILGQIVSALAGLTQIAHATNSNVIVGNRGAVDTGAQTASPTNIGR